MTERMEPTNRLRWFLASYRVWRDDCGYSPWRAAWVSRRHLLRPAPKGCVRNIYPLAPKRDVPTEEG